ncbi:MAG: bifunctional phosphoribosyl-AMP cyclohydrolase/phosphoribosyl-ATP diphosphatase HisIE [Solirubrobacterales bacterium]
MSADTINFNSDGLVPCVTQDARTGEVLTLAYMNEEALRLSLEQGEIHFWSRSRQEIWHKGETSGNTQRLVSLRYDCDGDALIAMVDPAGPACHTGERTCFYRDLEGATADVAKPVVHEAIPTLERTLAARRRERPEGSYTVELLEDPDLVGEKIREEAEEVVRAIAGESDERVAEEAADVLYHLEVGLTSRGISIASALEVLNARRR